MFLALGMWREQICHIPASMEFSLLGSQTRKKCVVPDKVSQVAIIRGIMEKNKGDAGTGGAGGGSDSLREKRVFHENPGGDKEWATRVPGDKPSGRGNNEG